MKKIFLVMVILMTAQALFAQETVVSYQGASLDSLVKILHKCSGKIVYYNPSEGVNEAFTFQEKTSALEQRIIKELEKHAFSVSVWDNALFVLRGRAMNLDVPLTYFTMQTQNEVQYQSPDDQETEVAASANKVYEVGDAFARKQDKAYVSGHITNVRTGEPEVEVSIFHRASNSFTQTNNDGFYRMLLPVGEQELELSGFLLEDSRLRLNLYSDGVLDIMMKDKVYSLKGVTVSAESSNNLRTNQMGLEKVRMDRIRHVPTVFGEADVLKVVLTLPGVKSVGEASGGFNVRGGATDQNLVLFNNGTMFNTNHLFGMFSAFNPDVVSDITLYKSSIPVEYGGRISSVLDVKSREGSDKQFIGSTGLGLLTTRAHIEGPLLKDKASFILGARATYSDWILGLLPQDSGYKNGSADFWDLTGGLNFKIDDHNNLSFNGYHSQDAFKFSADTSFSYANTNGALRWRHNFSEKYAMDISAGYDRYSYSNTDSYNAVSSYILKYNLQQAYAKAHLNLMLNEQHRLSYGMDLNYLILSPGSYLPYNELSYVEPRYLPVEHGLEPAIFVGDNWEINDKLSMEFGIRYSGIYNTDAKKFYHGPEFRVSGRYSITGDISVKAGFNSMRQNIQMLTNTTAMSPTDTWKLVDENIRPQTGWQAAGGLYAAVSRKRLEITLEAYYKSVRHGLDFKSGAEMVMNQHIANDVVETQTKAYGVELMLKKPLGKLNGWLSYTYSSVQLKEMGDRGLQAINRGDWYNAPYDKPHEFKFVGNYKLSHRFSFSLNVDYATGRPVTVPIGSYMYNGAFRLLYSERNSYRIPDYFRADAAINIEPTHFLPAFTHFSVTFGVYNITARKNAYSIYYLAEAGEKPQGYMLTIFGTAIPYINLNFRF